MAGSGNNGNEDHSRRTSNSNSNSNNDNHSKLQRLLGKRSAPLSSLFNYSSSSSNNNNNNKRFREHSSNSTTTTTTTTSTSNRNNNNNNSNRIQNHYSHLFSKQTNSANLTKVNQRKSLLRNLTSNERKEESITTGGSTSSNNSTTTTTSFFSALGSNNNNSNSNSNPSKYAFGVTSSSSSMMKKKGGSSMMMNSTRMNRNNNATNNRSHMSNSSNLGNNNNTSNNNNNIAITTTTTTNGKSSFRQRRISRAEEEMRLAEITLQEQKAQFRANQERIRKDKYIREIQEKEKKRKIEEEKKRLLEEKLERERKRKRVVEEERAKNKRMEEARAKLLAMRREAEWMRNQEQAELMRNQERRMNDPLLSFLSSSSTSATTSSTTIGEGSSSSSSSSGQFGSFAETTMNRLKAASLNILGRSGPPINLSTGYNNNNNNNNNNLLKKRIELEARMKKQKEYIKSQQEKRELDEEEKNISNDTINHAFSGYFEEDDDDDDDDDENEGPAIAGGGGENNNNNNSSSKEKKNLYALYQPKKLVGQGFPHPDPVVETTNLSMVAPPEMKYKHLLDDIVQNKGISNLQLEAVMYAYQRFESPLIKNSNGTFERKGFFLGDGAGVGKGRQIAATCIEHFRRKKRRVLWVSVSQDLKLDSERDITDLTNCCQENMKPQISIYPPGKSTIPSKRDLTYPDGILFSTYSLLSTGLGKDWNKKAVRLMEEGDDFEGSDTWKELAPHGTRLRQFIQWLKEEDDEDPLIIFDECHKAKNLAFAVTHKKKKNSQEIPMTEAKKTEIRIRNRAANATKTALCVIALQNALPKARILYASATGASEPAHLAYMQRLGLWGDSVLDNPFDDFQSFLDLVGRRHGMSAMEVFAMGMKQQGMYLSRQLSYQGASFRLKKCDINAELLEKYNKGVIFFQVLFNVFTSISKYMKAAQNRLGEKGPRKNYNWDMKQFWAAHQRFFRSMLMSAKVPTVVEEAKRAIKDDEKCVVIGLQSTGESAVNNKMKDSEEDEEQNDFVSAPKMTLFNLVNNAFHCHMEIDNPLNHRESYRLDNLFVQISQCVKAWEDLENGRFTFHPMNFNTTSISSSRATFPSRAASRPSSLSHNNNNNMEKGNNRNDTNVDSDSDSDIEVEKVKSLDEVLAEKRAKAILTGAFIDLEDDTNIAQTAEIVRQERQWNSNQNKNSSTTTTSTSSIAELKEKEKSKEKEKEKDIKPVIGHMATSTVIDLCSDIESDDEDDNTIIDLTDISCNTKDTKPALPLSHTSSNIAIGNSTSNSNNNNNNNNNTTNNNSNSNSTKREKKPTLNDIKGPVLEDKDFSNSNDMDIDIDIDIDGTQYVENARLIQIKKLLLHAIDLISLPANPLDDLIDQLGGREKVAELTGRKGSLVRDPITKKCIYKNRNDTGDDDVKNIPMKQVNLQEKQKFMNGDKFIAIISDAASCGISLQADRRIQNQRRRLHITLELPWSAEKAIQQFGRSHRSNQSSAPEYMIVITNLGGEKRFASAAAKRLSSLGAILKGDRRALGAGTNLKEFDIDNKYGKEALKEFYEIIVGKIHPSSTIAMPQINENGESFIERTCKTLIPVAIIEPSGQRHDGSTKYILHKSISSDGSNTNACVSRFLNRLLGVPTADQNEIFEYFSALFDANVQKHKETGDYNKGVVELRATSSRILEDKVLHKDPVTMATTRAVTVELDVGRDWPAINEIYEKNIIESTKKRNKENEALEQNQNDDNSSKFGKMNGFYIRKTATSNTPFVLLATEISNSYKRFRIRRPNNEFSGPMYKFDLEQTYRHVPKANSIEFKEIERLWKFHYNRKNSHRELLRTQHQYLLVGPLPIWRLCAPIIRKYDKKDYLTVLQIEAKKENGQVERLVGISLPYKAQNEIIETLINADGDFKKALEMKGWEI